jgi:hypothetical protein
MKVPKPTDADRERFRSFVPDRADVEIKPMFGNLGAFVNRNTPCRFVTNEGRTAG